MARQKNSVETVQFNMTIPKVWKTELELMALEYSKSAGRIVNLQEFIRVGLQEHFNLSKENGD